VRAARSERGDGGGQAVLDAQCRAAALADKRARTYSAGYLCQLTGGPGHTVPV
jgi:hypothetical protein